MTDTQAQLAELRRKLKDLEALRDVLGDEAVTKAQAELETHIRVLVETGGGTVVTGDVQVQSGDFVGRDKVSIDASTHDRHDVHITATGDVVYAPGGARPALIDLPPSEYNLAAVRELLTIALGDTEMTTLAFDHFRPAHESFGRGMGKDEKVQVLVEYCERAGRTGDLLELVRHRNPGRYAEYATRLHREPPS